MQFHRSLAGAVLFSLFPVSGAFAADPITADVVQIAFAPKKSLTPETGRPEARVFPLVVDFAGILHIEGGMSAIAVGNLDIADASLANYRTVIVTGRMAGTTNLIALDDAGRVLADIMVRVSSQKPGFVTVRRGTKTQSYLCASGLCEGGGNEPVSEVTPVVAGSDG
jgi:hypothetical protein